MLRIVFGEGLAVELGPDYSWRPVGDTPQWLPDLVNTLAGRDTVRYSVADGDYGLKLARAVVERFGVGQVVDERPVAEASGGAVVI